MPFEAFLSYWLSKSSPSPLLQSDPKMPIREFGKRCDEYPNRYSRVNGGSISLMAEQTIFGRPPQQGEKQMQNYLPLLVDPRGQPFCISLNHFGIFQRRTDDGIRYRLTTLKKHPEGWAVKVVRESLEFMDPVDLDLWPGDIILVGNGKSNCYIGLTFSHYKESFRTGDKNFGNECPKYCPIEKKWKCVCGSGHNVYYGAARK